MNVHCGTRPSPALSGIVTESEAVSAKAMPMEYGPGPPLPIMVVSTTLAQAREEDKIRIMNA